MQIDLSITRTKFFETIPLLLFAMFIITLPRYTDFAKTWYVLLILFAFVYLALNLGEIKRVTTIERILLVAVLANFFWMALSYYLNGEPPRGDQFLWGRHFYFLFFIPLFFLLLRLQIQDRYILLCLVISVSVSFIDMAIDLLQGIDHREQGMNPNSLAPIQLCLGGILFFYYLDTIEPRWLRNCALVGAVLAVATVVASGSKNAWMTFIVLSFFYVFYLASMSLGKKFLFSLLILAISSSSYLVIPYVKERMDKGLGSISRYFSSEAATNLQSLGTFGARAELWKEAYHVFLDKPLLGAGLGGVKPMAAANRDRYQTSKLLDRYKYVHNQYLAILATRGAPGLILFLIILITPIYIAMSTKTFDLKSRVAQQTLIGLCLVYLIGNMFEDYFESKPSIMFVSVFLPLWLTRLRHGESCGENRAVK